MAPNKFVGMPLMRKEDPALLKGIGKYLDDINLESQLWMHAVRSPFAHAIISSIDSSSASDLEGVVAIYTAKDFDNLLPAQVTTPPGVRVGGVATQAIAKDRVMYVGEIVAIVIATSKAVAEDAVAHVDVAYEPLTPVIGSSGLKGDDGRDTSIHSRQYRGFPSLRER